MSHNTGTPNGLKPYFRRRVHLRINRPTPGADDSVRSDFACVKTAIQPDEAPISGPEALSLLHFGNAPFKVATGDWLSYQSSVG